MVIAAYLEGRLTKLYLLLRYLIIRYFVLNIGVSKCDETDLGAIPGSMDCWKPAGWCVAADCGGFVRFQPSVLFGVAGGADPAIRWLFWALAFYFVGGGWLFWLVNQRYAEKLKQLVAGFQNAGFQPQLEVSAKINDAYLGIDGSARRLLAYPVKGAEYFSGLMTLMLGGSSR